MATNDFSNNFLDGSDLGSYYKDQQNRIPRGSELEASSSDSIFGLLNPPDYFPEVDRRSAEVASGRGISGSPAGFGGGLRMTDEEKLKRISLGQGFLTSAMGRNPAIDPSFLFQTPQQKAQLELDKQRLELQKKAQELENELKRLQIRNLSTPSVRYLSGGGAGGGGHSPVGAPLGFGNSGFVEDRMAAADAAFGRSIGGWGATGTSPSTPYTDLPGSYDPEWDWTG